ncbi:terminase small subunit [Pokkaliibacter sp. CJK22405]|uniref:terminase small subunit n=1 Tax=Pokkaliibacter sp. CJK22405 TaxID=3384615 RepID=UPI003984E911
MAKIVNKNEFAEIIGKSPRWVTELMEKGLPHTGGGGKGVPVKIETAQAIAWLIQNELAKHIDLDGEEPSGGKKDSEDIALKRARREQIELNTAIKRGTVAPIAGFMDLAQSIASVWASGLDGLASRTCGVLAGMDDAAEIRQYLYAETRQIRASTSLRLLESISGLAEEAADRWSGADSNDDQFTTGEDGE